MKNRFKAGAQIPCLNSVNQTALHSALAKEGPTWSDLSDSSHSVQPSPTQSNRIQPNPTAPSPLGKEIGKETVKFLALFDHHLCAVLLRFLCYLL